jgi:hypothetical protein
MLYGSFYYLLSLYPNLRAYQVPRYSRVDNGMKVMVGGNSHTSMNVWWELEHGRMHSCYLGSNDDIYLIIDVVAQRSSGKW